MRYLKSYESRAYGQNYVSILDEDIEKYLPKKIDIYTVGAGGDGGGNFTLELDAVTREVDILRVPYSQNTLEDVDYDVSADGEPDNLEFDMHFIRVDGKQKINVDVTYGDSMVSSFSIISPCKVIVNHYTGLGSSMDSDTHFGICDESLEELVKFFNRFGFSLDRRDFTFIDKYPDTFVHESLKLTPLSGNQKLLLVNNSKPHENRYFKNLQKWCQNRGIEYEIAISGRDVERIIQNENIVGAILSGSDFRITKPMDDFEGEVSKRALEILGCPILGICYGFQTMAKFYGGQVEASGKLHLENRLLTEWENHPLFNNVKLDNTKFSFAYNDIVTSIPDGFKVIAKIDDVIAGIANDEMKRFGLLFHPEDIQRTYEVLDNFVSMFHNSSKEQDLLKQGKFQYLESFHSFVNESSESKYIREVFEDVIDALEPLNFEVEIKPYDTNKDAYFSQDEMPDIILNIQHRDRIVGEQFDYTQKLYDLLKPYLNYLEGDSEVLLVGVEYEYLQNFKMGQGLYRSHFDHLLDMKDYKHYITHRSINNKLSRLRFYFRFEN